MRETADSLPSPFHVSQAQRYSVRGRYVRGASNDDPLSFLFLGQFWLISERGSVVPAVGLELTRPQRGSGVSFCTWSWCSVILYSFALAALARIRYSYIELESLGESFCHYVGFHMGRSLPRMGPLLCLFVAASRMSFLQEGMLDCYGL